MIAPPKVRYCNVERMAQRSAIAMDGVDGGIGEILRSACTVDAGRKRQLMVAGW
jgi:hypothetical protein